MGSEEKPEGRLFDEKVNEILRPLNLLIEERRKDLKQLEAATRCIDVKLREIFKEPVKSPGEEATSLASDAQSQTMGARRHGGRRKGKESRSYEENLGKILFTLNKKGGYMSSMKSFHKESRGTTDYSMSFPSFKNHIVALRNRGMLEIKGRKPSQIQITEKGKETAKGLPYSSRSDSDIPKDLPFKLPSYALDHPSIADGEMDDGTYQKLTGLGLLKRVDGFSVWTRKAFEGEQKGETAEGSLAGYRMNMLALAHNYLKEAAEQIELADAASDRDELRGQLGSADNAMDVALLVLEETAYNAASDAAKRLKEKVGSLMSRSLREDLEELKKECKEVEVDIMTELQKYGGPHGYAGHSPDKEMGFRQLIGNMDDDNLLKLIKKEPRLVYKPGGKYKLDAIIDVDGIGLGIVTEAHGGKTRGYFPEISEYLDLPIEE